MKRILQEPLLHFLLLGAGLFVVYGLIPNRDKIGEQSKIVITKGQIENLATTFAKSWQRPPTAEELLGLVRERIREEVYFREALALGLDKDDTVIIRRLRQKMEFVSDDVASLSTPTDAELDAYLQAHPAAFQGEKRFTFSQVYLNPAKHNANLALDASQLVKQLNRSSSKVDASTLGDPILAEHHYDAISSSDVEKLFGKQFALALAQVSPGQWQGPVESSYGLHLVLVSERIEGGSPPLAAVRDAVLREWTNTRRLESNEKFYQDLLKHYAVTIDGLDAERTKLVAAK